MQDFFQDIQIMLLETLEERRIKVTVTKLKKILGTSSFMCQVQLQGMNSLKTVSGGPIEIDEIFEMWNAELVWSFLDVTLLKLIVRRLGSDVLKNMMFEYCKQLEEFRRKTTVFMLVKVFPELKSPVDFEACKEAILSLKENAKYCTLEKLEVLRKFACEKLKKFKLSEAALVLFKVSSGSVLLIWLVHNNTVDEFKHVLRECIAARVFFKENNIARLELDGEIFMPMEEVSDHCAQFFHSKCFIVPENKTNYKRRKYKDGRPITRGLGQR